MARAIQPFATGSDGDTLYAVTTGEVDNPKLSSINLGLLASEVAWDAVLASIPLLPSIAPSSPFALSDKDLDLYVGAYEFDQGIRALVHRNSGCSPTSRRETSEFLTGKRADRMSIGGVRGGITAGPLIQNTRTVSGQR
jgi:hypothetical protein